MKYDCDGGSIMIGNESFRVRIPNGYGDGCFPVQIITERFSEKTRKYSFCGAVEGTDLNIYEYDCLDGEELKNGVLKKLESGRYGVYVNNGKVILEKWR